MYKFYFVSLLFAALAVALASHAIHKATAKTTVVVINDELLEIDGHFKHISESLHVSRKLKPLLDREIAIAKHMDRAPKTKYVIRVGLTENESVAHVIGVLIFTLGSVLIYLETKLNH